MSSAYNMHAQWRAIDPRRLLEMCKRHGGRVTPYCRGIGTRSYIVSWATADAPDCEGNLYVLRVRAKPVEIARAAHAPCGCDDEGRMCEEHANEAMREHAWMRGRPLSVVTGVLSDEQKQDLRDAGRGHLVRP